MNLITRTQLKPEDESLFLRSVGAYEYLLALKGLDAFLATASDEEFAALNEWVAEREEFIVYRNLYRGIGQTTAPILTRPPSTTNVAGEHEGRGLEWVVALARVELAAMMALFSSQQDPFTRFGPSPMEAAAWLELIADGASVHYAVLEADPWFRGLDKAALDQSFFAQQKHVRLTGQMLAAVARAIPTDVPNPTRKKIDEALKNIESTATMMNFRLSRR